MRVYIEDIGAHEGEEVTIYGWLHNRRSSGKIHFLTLRDGSGFIQAVMSKAAVGEELFKAADHLSQETSLDVTGTVRADQRAPGGYELDVTGLKVNHEAHDFPITPKEHGVDFLMDRRHLWIRAQRQQSPDRRYVAQRLIGRIQMLLRRAGDRHVGSLRAKLARDGETDPARAAGDERNLSTE